MASLYDDPELYDLFPASSEAVAFYRDEARKAGGPVLELACGTGRLAIPIAQGGVRITGLDNSPAMLAHARAKAQRAAAQIEFVEADMRRFEFPEQRFKLIFIAYNSLQHLLTRDDLMTCLACVRTHLDEGGVFLFDVFNPSLAILARDKAARFPVGRVTVGDGTKLTVQETTDYDAATQVSRITWYWSQPGAPDFRVMQFDMRSLFPQELPLVLEAAGFRLWARYGDFDRSAFASASRHQICVCAAT